MCPRPIYGLIASFAKPRDCRTHVEYKLLQLLGITLLGGGVVAANMDATLISMASIMAGAISLLCGLAGAWFNED